MVSSPFGRRVGFGTGSPDTSPVPVTNLDGGMCEFWAHSWGCYCQDPCFGAHIHVGALPDVFDLAVAFWVKTHYKTSRGVWP